MNTSRGMPLGRWTSKNKSTTEISITSINQSLNASLLLRDCTTTDVYLPSNISLSLPNSQGSCGTSGNKTPNCSPSRRPAKLTPSHSANRSGAMAGAKTPTNGVNRAKTPNRTPSGPDRFIPDRSNLNIDVSHYLLTNAGNQENPDANEEDNNIEREKETQNRKALSEALNGDLSSFRIIPCHDRSETSARAPVSEKKSAKKTYRYISSQAERILDAPDVKNDYYLQLIDWSDANLLAVALLTDVYIWNSFTGDISNLMSVSSPDFVTSLSWLPGRNHVAIGLNSHSVQLWDVQSGKKLRNMRGHTGRVSSLSWNAHILSSGSQSGEIHHHDVRLPNHLVGQNAGHSLEVCGLKWSPSGSQLASGGNDNIVNIWSQSSTGQQQAQPIRRFDQHRAAVKAMDWCPWESNLLATGGGTADRHLKLWDVSSGQTKFSVDTTSQVCAVLWSEEHRELISGHGFCNNQLIIWKYSSATGISKVQELLGHSNRVLGMGKSPDGQTVVSLGADETLRFWDCFIVDKDLKKKREALAYKENVISNPMRLGIR